MQDIHFRLVDGRSVKKWRGVVDDDIASGPVVPDSLVMMSRCSFHLA